MFWYNCLYCAISWDYARLIYLLLNSLNELKEIFNKTKVEEKQELIHMMNIVGNQSTHEAADHYGWKEGSTEKLLLHGAIGALTGSMSGGNALSGAVAGSLTGDRTKGPEKGISGFIYAENTNSYNKGIAYLKQEGLTQDSAVSLFKEYNRYLRLGVDWKHPAVRLPGIQADVDKNYKVINSSGIPRTADCIADEIDIRCRELI